MPRPFFCASWFCCDVPRVPHVLRVLLMLVGVPNARITTHVTTSRSTCAERPGQVRRAQYGKNHKARAPSARMPPQTAPKR